jgi:hypothetical protein
VLRGASHGDCSGGGESFLTGLERACWNRRRSCKPSENHLKTPYSSILKFYIPFWTQSALLTLPETTYYVHTDVLMY